MQSATIDKLAWIEIQNRRALYVRTKGKSVFYNPGGKRETGESDVQALVREVQEELAVTLLPETIQPMHTFRAQAHGKPEGTLVEIKAYTAQYDGLLRTSSEIEEIAWLTSSDGGKTTETGRLILSYLFKQGLID